MPRRSAQVLLTAVLAAILGLGLVTTILPARAADAAAKQTATRFLDLVAEGGESDLDELWSMTVSDSPGAMRTAGLMLVGAKERIEVLSVGEPAAAGDVVGAPYGTQLEEPTVVGARIRVDGKEWDWAVTVAKKAGSSGRQVDDWRVLTSALPALNWGRVGFVEVDSDTYVSGLLQVRREKVGQHDETVQPLYPAVYQVQRRMDPWYTSATKEVVVVNDPQTPAPDFSYQPTKRTVKRIESQIFARLDRCWREYDYLCPAFDLAARVGVKPGLVPLEQSRGWWGGVTKMPRISLRAGEITLTGGLARVRGRQGVREVAFHGSGKYQYDIHDMKPTIFELNLVPTS